MGDTLTSVSGTCYLSNRCSVILMPVQPERFHLPPVALPTSTVEVSAVRRWVSVPSGPETKRHTTFYRKE